MCVSSYPLGPERSFVPQEEPWALFPTWSAVICGSSAFSKMGKCPHGAGIQGIGDKVMDMAGLSLSEAASWKKGCLLYRSYS